MNISFKGDYALKALIDIGINEKNGPVSLRDVSERQDVPLKFLEQIFLLLKREGLVIAKRGKDGGYKLAVNPDDLTVGRIIRVVEGTLRPITCISKNKEIDLEGEEYTPCNYEAVCAMKKLWIDVYKSISQIVDNKTLQNLIDETLSLKSVSNYYQI